jgi:hypothetical protein
MNNCCDKPPVIHHLAARAAILLSQNKNSTDILQLFFFARFPTNYWETFSAPRELHIARHTSRLTVSL